MGWLARLRAPRPPPPPPGGVRTFNGRTGTVAPASGDYTATQVTNAVNDSAGTSAPLKDNAGTQLVNIPPWQTATLYPQNYVVQSGGVAYRAATTFTSGASFGADGANWIPLSSTEVGYASITSNFTTTSGSAVAVTGLTTTVTVGSRPILILVRGEFLQNNTAGDGVLAYIYEDGSPVADQEVGFGAVNECYGVALGVRRSPAAGSHTYAVYLAAVLGGTAKLGAGSAHPGEIEVIQV